jgi:hypothetical protein
MNGGRTVKHLTFKNVVLAFVALNILSTFSTSQMVGTFQNEARPKSATVPPAVDVKPAVDMKKTFDAVARDLARSAGSAAPAGKTGAGSVDPALIAHLFPGEALLPADVAPVAAEPPSPPAAAAPPHDEMAKLTPAKKPRVSNPPGVNWLMLLAIGGMALYARYLAFQMAQTAISQAVDSVKQIAVALGTLGAGVRAPTAKTAPARAPIPPKAPAAQVKKTASATVRPRSCTVVRASRWPFAA